jgi:hypothetical protein
VSTEEPADEPETPHGGRRRARGEGFALLGETLLTGVLVLVGSIPVVTVPAALAAGAAHLRRHVGGYDTSVRGYVHDWLVAVRSLWVLGVLLLGVVAVVVVNTGLTASGALPGAPAVRWVTWLAAACAAVVLLRAATAWSDDEAGGVGVAPGAGATPGGAGTTADGTGTGPGTAGQGAAGARQVLSRGAARSRDDLTGSALLLAALVMCAVLVWMLTPLVLVTGGLLSLAAVAVETRRAEGR